MGDGFEPKHFDGSLGSLNQSLKDFVTDVVADFEISLLKFSKGQSSKSVKIIQCHFVTKFLISDKFPLNVYYHLQLSLLYFFCK